MDEDTVLVAEEEAENDFDWDEMDIEDYVDEHALIDEHFEEDY